MVVFTCNACGDSLKKNKVDNHRYQCRMGSLSCVDCLKDFNLDSYSAHNECITEDQKYGGLNYKQQEFKGKAKQNDWMQKIKDVISSNKHSGHMKSLLERLLGYDNIPRKKPKFGNFVKNSFGLRNEKIINDIWDIFEKATKVTPDQNGSSTPNNNNNNNNQNGTKRSLETPTSAPTQEKKLKTEEPSPTTEDEPLKMKDVIKKCLKESDDQELMLKKLRKKVLKLYRVHGYEDDDSIGSSFDKVVHKRFTVREDEMVALK